MATDDEAARKARADAIRRKRDQYNGESSETEASTESDDTPRVDDREGSSEPNYAAWINKKMRDER
jgi:hypothetical protein